MPLPNPAATPGFEQRWKDASRDQRRALIIDAAFTTLHQDGPDALTIRRLASALGLGAMTLYTYVDGLDDLHRQIIARGFVVLHERCSAACENGRGHDDDWMPGARAYVQFAIDHPNLYRLMFDTPVDPDDEQFERIMHGGFAGLLEAVRHRLAHHDSHSHLDDAQLDAEALSAAGRYWISLHGLATLVIAGRMQVLHGGLDRVLEHLLQAVAPTHPPV